MRRRLNRRGLLAMIGLTAGMALSVHLLHGAQAKRNARALLDQAELAEADGNQARAKDYLGRYLTYEPDDVDSLTRYVRTLDPKKDPEARQQAAEAYERTLRRNPGRDDARRLLVDLLMRMAEDDPERYADAKAHLGLLVANAPNDPGLAYQLGRAEEGLGHIAEAITLYVKAREDPTHRVDCHVRLAELLRGKGEAERADRVMDASAIVDGLISRDDRSAPAYLARARYRTKYDVHAKEAKDDVARALEQSPDDDAAIRAAAASARDRGDLVEARSLLKRGMASNPQVLAIYEDLAELEWQSGHPEDAIALLRRAIEILPGELSASWVLVDLLIREGRSVGPDGAGAIIEAMRERGARPEFLGVPEARILAARGQWAEAAAALARSYPALLSRVDAAGLAKQALVLLGECSEQLGDLNRAYEAFRRAASLDTDPDPLWATARLKLSNTLMALNRIDDALAECRAVYARDDRAGPALARLLILQCLQLPAEERASRLAEADRVVGDLFRKRPEAVELTILRTEILATGGRAAEARGLLEEARDRHPDSVDLWVALATQVTPGRTMGEALALLDEAERRLGDLAGLRLARASLLASRGDADADADAAKALEALERGLGTFSTEDQARLLAGLASAFVQIGRPDHAERLWRQSAEIRPNDLATRLILYDLALKSGDAAIQDEALRQIDRIEGGRQQGPLWQYGRARLLTARSKGSTGGPAMLAEARALLGRVAERRPAWSRVPIALAEIAELAGDPEAALKNSMRGVLELGDRSPSAISQVVRLLANRGRPEQVDALIRRLQQVDQPLPADLRRLAANAALRSHNHSRALELAEGLVSPDTKDHRELIWIGQIREAAGQDAEPALRRAVAMASDDPEAWVALVLYLSRHDRAKAEAATREAEAKLSERRTPLALAACFEAIGRADRADALFQKALADRPDDRTTRAAVAGFQIRAGRPQEAGPHLRRILELGSDSPEADWARRTLALLTANGRTPEDEREALKLLGDPDGDPAAGRALTIADRRTRAKVLAIQPGRNQRREAISILEEIAGREPPTAEDLFLLAHLHESTGDWDKAHRCLLGLVDLPGEGGKHLPYLILALLRHGRVDEAQAYLNRLEGRAPGRGEVVELKARVLKARGRGDEAVALLQSFAKADETRAGPVARLLEELGRPDAAEPLYRSFADRYPRPEAVLTLASFLGRQGRIQEALDLCDRAWPVAPALASTSSVIILYSDGSDDAQRERVGRRIEEALRGHPERTSLRFDLANLRSLQERYTEAEAIYRSLSEQDKSSSDPLNNLAWLLALIEGRGAEALSLVDRAIAMRGETPALLDTRAMAYLALGRADDAARDLEDSLAAGPNAEKYLHLARAYRMAGKSDDAGNALRSAEEAGLDVEALHPLEKASYHQLVATLAK